MTSVNSLRAEQLHSIQTRAHGAIGRDISLLLRSAAAQQSRFENERRRSSSVFVRAAMISLVTNWETYFEEAIAALGFSMIEATRFPNERVQRTDEDADPINQGSAALRDLGHSIGDTWRANVSEQLQLAIKSFHSPTTSNIRRLSLAFVGGDLTMNWKFKDKNSSQCGALVDQIIVRRGQLVHFGLPRDVALEEAEVHQASELLQTLVGNSAVWLQKQYHATCAPLRC